MAAFSVRHGRCNLPRDRAGAIVWRVFDRCNKAVATPGNGLNENGVLRVIAEDEAESFQSRIEAAIKFDVSVSRPKFLAQLFASDDLARTLQ